MFQNRQTHFKNPAVFATNHKTTTNITNEKYHK